MDASNGSYVSLAGFVELHKYRCLYFVIIFTAYVLIIGCNVTVMCVIRTHRNLHQPMYAFIAALLLNSVLYSTTVYPKLLMDVLSDQQIITHSLCLFQAFVYYTLAGSEFLLLSAMAYDRYVSICEPLRHPAIMRRTTVIVFLGLAWLVPVCEVSASVLLYFDIKLCNFTLKGISCNTSLYALQCVRSVVVSVYGVVVLSSLALFPSLFILFTYVRIFILTYERGKAARAKAAHTCLPHLLVLINLSCFVTYDIAVVRLDSEIPKIGRFVVSLQMILYHPLFNPIIYGLKMKEIHKHLKKLLTVKLN